MPFANGAMCVAECTAPAPHNNGGRCGVIEHCATPGDHTTTGENAVCTACMTTPTLYLLASDAKSCLATCPAGQWSDPATTPRACSTTGAIADCTDQTATNVCNACTSPKVVKSDKTACEEACAENEFALDGVCTAKIPNCKTQTTATTCDECDAGKSLNSDKTACIDAAK